jgi:hypothetical protein
MGEGETEISRECWLGKAGWLVETPLGTSGCRPSRGSRDTLFKYLKIKELLLTRFPGRPVNPSGLQSPGVMSDTSANLVRVGASVEQAREMGSERTHTTVCNQ